MFLCKFVSENKPFVNSLNYSMRKFLLFVFAVMAVAGSTYADGRVKIPAYLPGVPVDDKPVYDPEGTDEVYIMNVTENDQLYGTVSQVGYKMNIRKSADGSTIWFRDLTPGFNPGDTEYAWVKGTVNGDEITVRAGQIVYYNEMANSTLYLEVVTMNEFSAVDKFESEMKFTVKDGIITQTDNTRYIGVYRDGETMDDAGFFLFMNEFVIQPVGELPKFAPAETTEVQPWIMSHADGSTQVKVAFEGDNVFIAGLSSMAPDDYVPGTIADGKLTIKTGYILTSHPLRYVRLVGAQEAGTDEFGFPQFSIVPSYTFSVDADRKSLTLEPDEAWIMESDYEISAFFSGVHNVRLFYYAGDVPAVPATPEILGWNDFDGIISFNLASADVNGSYINPEKLSYRIYLDGVQYKFSTDSYFGLTEDMTEIPYGFTDYYDIYSNGDFKNIYLHAPEWDAIEIEAVYTVDGVTNTSARAYFSRSGVSDIEASEIVGESYTDIYGCTVVNPAAGSMVIRTTRYSDGSVRHDKHIVR